MAADEPTVIDHWVRMRVLGSGGFGVVTLWKHKNTSQTIAIKKCRSELYPLMNPKQQERWEKEVEIMLRLDHKNVVKAMPVPEKAFEETLRKGAARLPLLCMEFCARGDLRQVLNKAENCCGLRENEVRSLIQDVSSAVEYLHSRNITHRDLKPENIVLQEVNERIVYKLIDLGYAKELDQNSVCASFVGTLQYLAPELFMSQKYNHSVDYWSLGLVSHEVITGVRPFLPNMPPVTWMNRVEKKSPKDICAYQDYDGNIIFSQQLFPQNHISQCLKYYMEQWLPFCLDWDSKRRGRAFSGGDESRVVVFSMVNEILSKKVVNIFSVPTYDILSYEVDESTRLSTLQGWIERDTSIPVTRQEVLSSVNRGKTMNPDEPALPPEFFQDDRKGKNWVECTLFIFLKDSLEIPQVPPTFPQLVEKMLNDPRRLIEYHIQKRMWANAVFFLQQEAHLFRQFLHAYKVKMLHLYDSYTSMSTLWQKMRTEYQQTLSQHSLFSQSLKLDESLWEEHVAKIGSRVTYQKSVLEGWTKNGDAVSKNIPLLEDAVETQEKRCSAIASLVSQFKSNPAPRDTPYHVLEPLVLAGQKCYEQLCRRPKEVRYKKSDNVDMVKVVYGCLKERDKLLRDKAFQSHLVKVLECQIEILQSMKLLRGAISQVTKLKNQLWSHQSQRQRDIWNLIYSSIPNDLAPVGLRQPSPNINNVSDDLEKFPMIMRSLQDITSPARSMEIKDQFPVFLPDMEGNANGHDAYDVLSENYSLRSAMQDLIHDTMDKFKSVVCEPIGDFEFQKLN
ncbi:inhibitor of nuclear factor kappa-B kinase subunit alpha [Ischnura elegans]|uniref:inhibitor of nuclear factor kappa-B kinase subunit alpha n=1 Tax=Ischnura elegans TaxID=197161 RepID=UPI001ED895EC|nr:inhibitor of nuclear factor kappa-B kinase subunit alpha [Ischnura elegans]